MIRPVRAIALPAALALLTSALSGAATAARATSDPLPPRDTNVGVVTASRSIDKRARTTPVLEIAEASIEDQVAEVQRMLVRHGFDPGPVDGRLGLRTRDAIRAYQDLVRAKEQESGAAEALARDKGPPVPVPKPATAE